MSNPIPSPVLVGDTVVCMTGYRGNAIYSIGLSASGDATGSNFVRWHRDDAAPYVASPALFGGRLYFTKERTGIMSSIDAATGEIVIPQTRLPEIKDVYSSPVAVDGKIYFTSRDGTTTVIRHADALDVVSTNSLGEPVDASLVIAGDRILIRGNRHLFCVGN